MKKGRRRGKKVGKTAPSKIEVAKDKILSTEGVIPDGIGDLQVDGPFSTADFTDVALFPHEFPFVKKTTRLSPPSSPTGKDGKGSKIGTEESEKRKTRKKRFVSSTGVKSQKDITKELESLKISSSSSSSSTSSSSSSSTSIEEYERKHGNSLDQYLLSAAKRSGKLLSLISSSSISSSSSSPSSSSSSSSSSSISSSLSSSPSPFHTVIDRRGKLNLVFGGLSVHEDDPLLPKINKNISPTFYCEYQNLIRQSGPVMLGYLVNDKFKQDGIPFFRYESKEDVPDPSPIKDRVGSSLMNVGWIISDLRARVEKFGANTPTHLIKEDEGKSHSHSSNGVWVRGSTDLKAGIHFIKHSTSAGMVVSALIYTNATPNTFHYHSNVKIVDNKIRIEISPWSGISIGDISDKYAKHELVIEGIDTYLCTVLLGIGDNPKYLSQIRSDDKPSL